MWARRERARMTLALGGSCAACSNPENLTFDCISPRGDSHHRKDSAARVSFYRREMRAGNLQILCEDCNSMKGNMHPDQWLHVMKTAAARLHNERLSCSLGKRTALTPDFIRMVIREVLTT